MAWKGIVGKRFSADEFHAYVNGLTWKSWKPGFVVLHNTAAPSLRQRPQGFTDQHIQNLVTYYRDTQKWSAGPHLFVDDNGIWVFTPLTTPGTHAFSWNPHSIGVEMLGDYAKESFTEGRGAKVRHNAVCAIASLCERLNIDSSTLRLHKENPETDHDCPGKNVVKADFIKSVHDLILRRRDENRHED